MKAIQIISQDLFDKVRSRFSNLEMGDETGAVTIDPAEARFFDFDFVKEGTNLGRVSISINELGSLKVYYSQGITENQDDPAKKIWYNFLKEMRMFAMRRLLRFDTRDIAKTNLDKNDFQQLAATQAPKEEPEMNNMNESRWSPKSSKKTSRAVKGTTEVIVRHHNTVDEMYPGARSQRKNIKAIFIQNREGERFKYPFIHPAGAFAMAQHVDHGGIPHDPAGKAIIGMSEEIAKLQEFHRKIHGASLHPDATGITERAIGRLNELKAHIEALGKRHHYENWANNFNEQEYLDDDLTMDDVTMEEYKSKFTETNFKEELASFFPILHKIMRETNKVDLEDYVKESPGEYTVHCSQCGNEFKRDKKEGYSHCKDHMDTKDQDVTERRDTNKFDQFAQWAEAIEQGQLTPDQIEGLTAEIDKHKSGNSSLSLDNAYNVFNEFGIDDDRLQDKLQAAATEFPDADPIDVFAEWAKQSGHEDLLVALGLENIVPPAQEPQQQEPQQQEPQPAEENDERSWTNSTMPVEGKSGMLETVAETVMSFFNSSNEDVGPFRSPETILLDVKKKVEEEYGEEMANKACSIAETLIQKLTNQWEEKHGKSAEVGSPDDDGLARIRELIGNVKQRVENITNKDSVADEGADMDKIPAYIRKDKQQSQDTAQKATDQRNQQSGTKVWNNPRLPKENVEMESILKLAGLSK